MIISMNPYDAWKIEVSEFSHLNLGIENSESIQLEDEAEVTWFREKLESRMEEIGDQIDLHSEDKILEDKYNELNEALEDLAAAREEQEEYEVREAEAFLQERYEEKLCCY